MSVDSFDTGVRRRTTSLTARHGTSAVGAVLLAVGLLTAISLSASIAGASPPASGEGWGTAQQPAGTSSSSLENISQITQMSCTSAGNCSALGSYQGSQYFVSDVSGTWGSAQVFNPGSQNTYQGLMIDCWSSGNCAMSGTVTPYASSVPNTVVDLQTNGTWGTPALLPGLTALNNEIGSGPGALSCDSSGNCVLVGGYTSNTVPQVLDPFVSYESGGTWSGAAQISSVAALAPTGSATIISLSCQSGGTCTGAGSFMDGSNPSQAFVVSESAGTWSTPTSVATTADLSDAVNSSLGSISCASDGNCTAGGYYTQSSGPTQAIVVSEASGVWSPAVVVPGTATLNAGKNGSAAANVTAVSCTGVGDCSIGGFYNDLNGFQQGFVDSQVSGTWKSAAPLPMTTGVYGSTSRVVTISCWSSGNCNAGGYYNLQDLVTPQRGGVWGTPITPASAEETPNYPAEVLTVSCASDGSCGAGGSFSHLNGTHVNGIAYVANYLAAPLATAPGAPTKVVGVPSKDAIAVSWAAPASSGGLPITGYTAVASPGGAICQATVTNCTFSFLNPAIAYSFTVTSTNFIATSKASSLSAPVYPFFPMRFTIEVRSNVVSKGVTFTGIAGDAKSGAKVTFKLSHATTESCTANSYGQCTVTMDLKATGAFSLKGSTGKSTSSVKVYAPLVTAPATLAHGGTATVTVTHCPPSVKVTVSLSDGRSFEMKSSSSGSATLKIPMPKAATEVLTTYVAGTKLSATATVAVT